MLMLLPDGGWRLRRVMVVPLTVMVSLLANPLTSESLGAVPDSAVWPVIGVGGVVPDWLLATVPAAVLSVLKKLSPASTADAAISEVLASVVIDDVSAFCRFVTVFAGVVVST